MTHTITFEDLASAGIAVKLNGHTTAYRITRDTSLVNDVTDHVVKYGSMYAAKCAVVERLCKGADTVYIGGVAAVKKQYAIGYPVWVA